ncbi:MAG: DMT family transporter [Mesorhizobium sp.]|nr:DMT family transporter [Mesorhizobium sp.]MBL8576377.1 DMT family transporter [Mesorhizobium sp.]
MMAQSPGHTRRAIFLAHLAMLAYALLIAGSFSFGALAAPHVPPTVLNALRFLAASVLMGFMLLASQRRVQMPSSLWRFLILGGLMAVYFVLMFVALRITDPVSTGAVFTLIPFMSAVFGWFLLKQKTRAAVWLGLLIAAIGALWVIFGGNAARAMDFRIGKGEAIFLVGCACQALYAPMVRLLSRGESILEFTVWTLVGCTVCLLPFALPELAQTDWSSLGWQVWLAIAYLVVGATAVSFYLLQYGSMHLPASKLFAYAYLTPSFVILLEILLGHGFPPLAITVGAAITCLGLVVIVSTPDKASETSRLSGTAE